MEITPEQIRAARVLLRLGQAALAARAHVSVLTIAEVARGAFLVYGRGRHPAALNLGDCAAYAVAKHRNVPLLFKGGDFSQTDLRGAA